MHPIRVRFAKEIVAEILPTKKDSNKVLIILSGMPSTPCKKELLKFWAQKGYWAVYPRYRGTWESEGTFLEYSPEKDVIDILNDFNSPKKDLWTAAEFTLPENPEFYLLGASFGGAAALLAAKDSRIKKAVVMTPVTDFTFPSEGEPIEEFPKQVAAAFGGAVRATKDTWEELKTGTLFNPINEVESIPKEKILFIHRADDTIVNVATAGNFVQKNGCRYIEYPNGGHMGIKNSMKRPAKRKILKFLKS